MSDVAADVNEFVTELAVGVVASLGHKMAQPLRTLKDRGIRDELELATTDAPEQDAAKLRASFVRLGMRSSPH